MGYIPPPPPPPPPPRWRTSGVCDMCRVDRTQALTMMSGWGAICDPCLRIRYAPPIAIPAAPPAQPIPPPPALEVAPTQATQATKARTSPCLRQRRWLVRRDPPVIS